MPVSCEVVVPGAFDPNAHFYPKALNSQMHSMVSHFFSLDHERIINRYTHLHPVVNKEILGKILSYPCKHFFWGGADLFYVTTLKGNRKMVVLETNSCPSGQKSLPSLLDSDEHRGYQHLIKESFLPLLKKKRLPPGVLGVLYDKNYMEASGYAATLADLTQEKVYLIPCYDKQEGLTIENGVLHFFHQGEKIPLRAALRYVTQRPWTRIPPQCKTFVYNSVLVCLAGGRNKLVANKAYELFNSEIVDSGLVINIPETVKDVCRNEIPLWVAKFGGKAVIKNPYSNAGQGVYTVTTEQELANFMQAEHNYDQFIVQSLIGHYNWSSSTDSGKFFHIGTVPNKKRQIFIADLRMMVYSTPHGFYPCAIYARRAKKPMEAHPPQESWETLGTNLSIKTGENTWESDTGRLILMDRKDFNSLGVGIDDLIEAYIQTVLSVIAIDKMASNLLNKKGQFRLNLFKSLDNDSSLIKELLI